MVDLGAVRRLLDSLSDAERMELAHELTKEIHRQGGRRLSRVEAVALAENPPHLLNGSERLPAGTRGKRSRFTCYDRRAIRIKSREFSGWRWLWKHYKAVPESRTRTGQVLLNKVMDAALVEVTYHPGKSTRTLARRVMNALSRAKQGDYDIGTIRRALQKLGFLKAKNPPG